MTYELRNELDKRYLSSLQENQIRKVHYVAKERLRAFIQVIQFIRLLYNILIIMSIT
jgi:hypothetical protein